MTSFKMKYPIIQRYLSGPSKRRPCLSLARCRFMVAHDTGNPGSTAAANVSYYERTHADVYQSAHIFVDDKEIIECIPFLTGPAEKAYHVIYDVKTDNARYGADANDAAGGVELCYGGKIDNQEAYKRYVWVMAYSCYRYGLNPATDITGHYILDPARRTDPQNALQLLGKTFTDFVADVAKEYADCLEEDDDMSRPLDLNLKQWRQLGDQLTGLSQLPGGPDGDPLISYEWAEKSYKQELTGSQAAYLALMIVSRMAGVAAPMRDE
ncbi:N-acetylmuramoyl-L-alanine amidase [Paenibacillus sp. JMULE4]|uniref:peptidoglycan recognition protein family protein n=1 Tax=Paenibacillus sp. JMULE4 TaxID=2518342 RepID=UPI00157658FA|nr:peptidoglycan recognition family protein [Paenibacillus sp. JMULE4]NTZ20948.1 N-acetylmuramoyl-L-alanine amidase [Paenibacillus sp. JMULE4]